MKNTNAFESLGIFQQTLVAEAMLHKGLQY